MLIQKALNIPQQQLEESYKSTYQKIKSSIRVDIFEGVPDELIFNIILKVLLNSQDRKELSNTLNQFHKTFTYFRMLLNEIYHAASPLEKLKIKFIIDHPYRQFSPPKITLSTTTYSNFSKLIILRKLGSDKDDHAIAKYLADEKNLFDNIEQNFDIISEILSCSAQRENPIAFNLILNCLKKSPEIQAFSKKILIPHQQNWLALKCVTRGDVLQYPQPYLIYHAIKEDDNTIIQLLAIFYPQCLSLSSMNHSEQGLVTPLEYQHLLIKNLIAEQREDYDFITAIKNLKILVQCSFLHDSNLTFGSRFVSAIIEQLLTYETNLENLKKLIPCLPFTAYFKTAANNNSNNKSSEKIQKFKTVFFQHSKLALPRTIITSEQHNSEDHSLTTTPCQKAI